MTKFTRRMFMAGVAATGAGSVFAPHVARAAPTVLRVSSPDGVTHPNIAIMNRFAELVAQRTSGALEVKIFPDAQLGNMANAVTGMQTGTIDFAITGPGFLEGLVPQLGVLSLPFVFPNDKVAERIVDGDLGSRLASEVSKRNIEILAWSTWGWRVTETVSRPIREPKDFQGLKIRLPPGQVFADTFRTLGAIPTTVDASELYLAVSQGTVDAFEVPFLSLVASKWYEVVKYVSLTNHAYNPVWLAMSGRRLAALPADQQKILRDTARELQQPWRAAAAEKSLEAQKFIEGRGIQIVQTDTAAFRPLLTGVYDRAKEKLGADLVAQLIKEASA